MAVDRDEFSFSIEDDFQLDNHEELEDDFYSEKKPEVKKDAQPTKAKKDPKEELPPVDGDELLNEFLNDDEDDEEDESTKKPVSKKEEVEDEGEDEEAEDESNEDDTDEEEEVNTWDALSKDLFKMGIFNLDEDEDQPEIKTPQDLKERFIYESKRNAGEMLDNFISSKGEEAEEAFRAIFINGLSPREYYGAVNEITSIKELDLSKPENQKMVTRKSLKLQGWEDEDIDAEIERLETYQDLEPASVRHQKALVKKEEAELVEREKASAARKEQERERKNKFLTNINTTLTEKVTNKEFDGIPVSKEFALKTKDFITTEKYKLPDGSLISEWDKFTMDLKRPENHQKLIKLAMLAQMLDTDPTLSTIKRKVNTDKINEEFSELARKGKTFKKAGEKVKKQPFI